MANRIWCSLLDTLWYFSAMATATFGTAVSYPTPYSGAFHLVVGNFNHDSHPDLAVSYYFGGIVSVFLGNSDGTFQPAIDTTTGFYYADNPVVADLNGDGISDLVM